MSRLDRARELGEERDVDAILEEVITARKAGTDPKELFGGPRDWIDSGVPPMAFFAGNLASGLKAGIIAAIVAEVIIVAIRLVSKETLRHAFSGAFGVAIAAFIAYRTGDAKNFFLPGIVINVVYALVFLVSAVFRHPLVGVIMRTMWEKPAAFHAHPRVRRAYTEITIGWAAMFGIRAVVQEYLRREDQVGWLAVTKIAMGYPLFIAALAVTLPYVKWRTRGVEVPPEEEPVSDEAAEGEPQPAGEHTE